MKRQWHILVVDDEEFNREVIAERLDDKHFRLEMAENGADAWTRLEACADCYDLILLDRMMPVMDGMELLRRMKADARFHGITVVMQTAAASAEQIRQGLQAGCYFYLTKPYNANALNCIVNAALEQLRLEQRLKHAGAELPPVPATTGAEYHFSSLAEAHRLSALLAAQCPDPAGVSIGLAELLINAVEHGNLNISYAEKRALKLENRWEAEVERRQQSPEYSARKALVRFARNADEAVFEVIDAGSGFDWRRYLEFDPERAFDPNGRGIAMAGKMAFSRLEYRGLGNHVVASIELS